MMKIIAEIAQERKTWIILAWFLIGCYGYAANWERYERTWGTDDYWGNIFQSSLTVLLGPVGILCVMTAGGRWNFWKRQSSKSLNLRDAN